MKLRCIYCGYTIAVQDPDKSPHNCERCKSGPVQTLPDDVQVVTISGTGDGGYRVTSLKAKDLPNSYGASVFVCHSCGLYQDIPRPIPSSARGLACPSCGSKLTRIIPFDDVERDMRAEAIGQEGEKLYQAGDYQQAVDKFQEALQLAPSNPNLLLDMGNTLADLGWKIGDRYKLQESVIYLTKALELFPDFDRARANLNVSRTKLADLR